MTPLVSCIMPTYNRRRFVPAAIRCFLQQDYPARELIIVTDGESIDDLLPPGATNIHQVRLWGTERASIGAKLNLGIQAAQGDLLAMWSDDDWHASQRLSVQVDALQASAVRMCGSDQVTFVDLRNGETWRYEYIPGRRTDFYLVGGTMLFTRGFWRERPFENISSAEDNAFIFQRGEPFCNVGSDWWYRALMHAGNTSPKPLAARQGSDQWRQIDGPARSFVDPWWWQAVSQETI